MVRDVVEFADRQHFEPVGMLEIADGDGLAPTIQMALLSRNHAGLVDAYVQKALSQGEPGLFAYISYLYEHRVRLWEIHDRIIQPAMAIIGNRWAHGELDIGREHRASYETVEALAKLQTRILIKPPTGRVAVCACLGEELHDIGLRCATYLAESEGWTTHYLGARTPLPSLLPAVTRLRPDLLCLSFTQRDGDAIVQARLRDLSQVARRRGTLLVVGGLGVSREWAEEGRVDKVIASSKELLDLLNELKRANGHRRKGC
jgi:methanogenic corrinoid protein MtbC1